MSTTEKKTFTMYKRMKQYAESLKTNDDYSESQRLCINRFIEDFEKHDAKSKPIDMLYFGKYAGEKIDNIMKLKTGRNYLFWLVRQSFWLSKAENVETTKYIYLFDPDTGDKIKKA